MISRERRTYGVLSELRGEEHHIEQRLEQRRVDVRERARKLLDVRGHTLITASKMKAYGQPY